MEDLEDFREARGFAGGGGGGVRTQGSQPSADKPKRDYGPFPDLYSIFHGTVKTVKDFGAFVELPGYRRNGLVHVSQMASYKVMNASENAEPGDRVWVKVISTDNDRVSLSMRVVDQSTGKDLDPGNVNIQRKPGVEDEEAELNPEGTDANYVCKKCGNKGHFEWNCFNSTALRPLFNGEFKDDTKHEGAPEGEGDGSAPAAAPADPALSDPANYTRVPSPSREEQDLLAKWEAAQKARADRDKMKQLAKLEKAQRKLQRKEEKKSRKHRKHHKDKDKAKEKEKEKEKDKGKSGDVAAVTASMTLAEARALLAAREEKKKSQKSHRKKHSRSPSPSSSSSSSSESESERKKKKSKNPRRRHHSASSSSDSDA